MNLEKDKENLDFRGGLDKIMSNIDLLDERSFKQEIINLHDDILEREKNFIPIDKERYPLLLRIGFFPFILIGTIIWSICFLISSTLFGTVLYRTGQNFLKQKSHGKSS